MIFGFLSVLAAAVLVGVDQLIKRWATAVLLPKTAMTLIPGVLELRYFLNDGMAFSMLAGKQKLLIAATSLMLLGVLWMLFARKLTPLERVAWTLVLGGGIGNLIDRIAALKNDPRSWAPRRLNELMCENENYGKSALGTIEQAERITPETLYAAYRRALSEAQVELFYCGTMMPDEVEAHFMATPLAQPREGTLYQPHTVVQARPAGDVREVVEDAEVTQGKLSLGFRTGGASLTGGEPAAYWMFQTIYGGSTSAKLFLNVREKKSLCYYASAQFVASKGLMIVNSGIENRNFEVARDEILHQLDLCRKGEITDAELESARKTLVNGWRTMLDDPLTLERYWMGQAAAGTLVSPEERIEQVTDITREQVIAAAQSTALDTVFFMKGAAK